MKLNITSLKKRRRNKKIKEFFSFKKREFSFSLFKKGKQNSFVSGLIIILMLTLGGMAIFKISLSAYGFFKKINIQNIVVSVAGDELPKDENQFTNILFLGIGGEGHDGAELTDSIIVVSIDEENSNIVMLSVPRDFWIDDKLTSGRINEILRDAPRAYIKKGYNEDLANVMAMDLLQDKIETLTGLKIQRYAKIDFRGFEKMIDAVDGIDVNVERTIDDNSYPDSEWGYEHFILNKGNQHLDGKIALKFARSRHDSSDFDRAIRQQKILEAFRQKTLSGGVLTSPSKIKDLFDVIKDNFESDLSLGEMISLADFASNFNRSNLVSRVLTDNDLATGGFLVTPDRELYGGAFVLVPYLNLVPDHKFDQIKMFSEIIFHYRYLAKNPPKIEIQNATYTTGLAREMMMHLERYGIPVEDIYTADEKSKTTSIEYRGKGKNEEIANLIARLIKAELIPAQSSQTADIIITLGADYKKPYRIPVF